MSRIVLFLCSPRQLSPYVWLLDSCLLADICCPFFNNGKRSMSRVSNNLNSSLHARVHFCRVSQNDGKA